MSGSDNAPGATPNAPGASLTSAVPATRKPAEQAGSPSLGSLVRQNEQAMAAALPRHIDAERFTRIALTAVRTTPKIEKCDPRSFLGALLTSAQLGLEPNTPLGHAYLIPFGKECTFILGYKGMLELARRNGVSVTAREVYEGEVRAGKFRHNLGTNTVDHERELDPSKRGDVVCYYALATWEGGQMLHVATLDEIERHRARSKSANRSDSPWKTDPDAMARKTCVRILFPYIPNTVEIATATMSDEKSAWSDAELETEHGIIDIAPVEDSDESATEVTESTTTESE